VKPATLHGLRRSTRLPQRRKAEGAQPRPDQPTTHKKLEESNEKARPSHDQVGHAQAPRRARQKPHPARRRAARRIHSL